MLPSVRAADVEDGAAVSSCGRSWYLDALVWFVTGLGS